MERQKHHSFCNLITDLSLCFKLTPPAGNSYFIILGDTTRTIYGFKVWRKDPGSREFRLLTPEEIKPVNDPYEAQQIIGRDYPWVARKVGTDDPVLLWQRLRGDRTLTLLLCLISHNLRVAMGRTYIYRDGIKPGNQYTYRIELINENRFPSSNTSKALYSGSNSFNSS